MWENLGTIGVLSRHDLNSLYSFIQLKIWKEIHSKSIQHHPLLTISISLDLLLSLPLRWIIKISPVSLDVAKDILDFKATELLWVPRFNHEHQGMENKEGRKWRNKLEILFFYLDRHEGSLYYLIFVQTFFFHCLLCRGHLTVHLFLLALRKVNNAFVLSSKVFQLVYLECRR